MTVQAAAMGWHKGSLEILRRAILTAMIMAVMGTSFLLYCAPVVVGIIDVVIPCALLSIFEVDRTSSYSFRSSLVDMPLLSLLRSLIIICVYSMFGMPGLSHGPYLWTAIFCGLFSGIVVTFKAGLFAVSCTSEGLPAVATGLHLKPSWGMTAMFLSSMVLALGHIVVAYKTRCKARRKLLFHRLDPEAVMACKAVLHGYQNVPYSSNPKGSKAAKAGTEKGNVPTRMLADVDSLFMVCEGLVVHYKIIDGKSCIGPPSSSSFCDSHGRNQCVMPGRLRFDNPLLFPPQGATLARSFSHNSTSDTLYAPLLASATVEMNPVPNYGFNSHSAFIQHMPVLNLDKYKHSQFGFPAKLSQPKQLKTGRTGIILIHGFGGGIFSWRHVMSPLERETGCAVAAFDRPGWGLTSRPGRAEWEDKGLPNPYELQSQVGLLFSFCQKLGYSSVVLVGHDDGGWLALMAAERAYACIDICKVEVKGVVLVSVSLSRELMPTFAQTLLHASLAQHMLHPLLRTELSQVANRRAWYDASKLTADIMDLYKAPLHVEGWDRALAELGKLSTGSAISSNHVSELLKVVQDMPVLIAAGAEDILVPLKSAEAVASRLPNSRLVAIPRCGHLPHEECPAALLAALLPFVSKLCIGSKILPR